MGSFWGYSWSEWIYMYLTHWVQLTSLCTNEPGHHRIKWKHFPRYWPIVRAINRSPVTSPHKGQWRGGALMFSLICARTNGWANNRDAGVLRRHRVHFVVIIIILVYCMLGSEPLYQSTLAYFQWEHWNYFWRICNQDAMQWFSTSNFDACGFPEWHVLCMFISMGNDHCH